MFGDRFTAIKPLFEAQTYINSVSWSDNKNGAIDFSTFRQLYERHANLALQHAKHVGAIVDPSVPWLTVDAPSNDYILIARTMRYHNPLFPWRRVLNHFQNKLFVGLPNEHKEFQEKFGEIEYRKTNNLLELAELIAGSKLLVCNQSCPFWIAAGLGTPLIQETFWGDMNSIVERENARYTRSTAEVNQLLETLQ